MPRAPVIQDADMDAVVTPISIKTSSNGACLIPRGHIGKKWATSHNFCSKCEYSHTFSAVYVI
jgi:hypothetical protein